MSRPESLSASIEEVRTFTLAAMSDAHKDGDLAIAHALGRLLNDLRVVSDQDALDRISDRALRLNGCLWYQIAVALDDRSLL